MQQLIDQIRTDGAGNVIVVPALGGETNLAGMPALTDPTDPRIRSWPTGSTTRT